MKEAEDETVFIHIYILSPRSSAVYFLITDCETLDLDIHTTVEFLSFFNSTFFTFWIHVVLAGGGLLFSDDNFGSSPSQTAGSTGSELMSPAPA